MAPAIYAFSDGEGKDEVFPEFSLVGLVFFVLFDKPIQDTIGAVRLFFAFNSPVTYGELHGLGNTLLLTLGKFPRPIQVFLPALFAA